MRERERERERERDTESTRVERQGKQRKEHNSSGEHREGNMLKPSVSTRALEAQEDAP